MTRMAAQARAARRPGPITAPPSLRQDTARRRVAADQAPATFLPDISRIPVHPENASAAAWPRPIQRCGIGSSCDCPPHEKLAGVQRDLRNAVSGGGASLPGGTRSALERAFASDFAAVRVHTGPDADHVASALHAQGLTTGTDILFRSGAYRPGTPGGDRLLAHELAHVVQQAQHAPEAAIDGGATDPWERAASLAEDRAAVQRSSAESVPGEGATAPPIVHRALASSGLPLRAGLRGIAEGRLGVNLGQVRIHTGATAAASATAVGATAYTVGSDIVFNAGRFEPDSDSGARLLMHELVHVAQQHGRAGASGALKVGAHDSDLEHEADRIAAGGLTATAEKAGRITRAADAPLARQSLPAQPQGICGPDATDWFVRQVAAAKHDPTVLAIQSNLLGANRVASRFGFSAERVAEGAVAKRVLAEEARAGSPARTKEATAQIGASVPGQREFGRATVAATVPIPFVGAPEQLVLLAIRRAGLAWKDLVGTGRRYDFKNDTTTMRGPTSPHCPTTCRNTITLCPGSGADCFRTDTPGNLFYAHLGRFIGWTELALQLGSEFAQLESTRTWDPPEDTRMISIGFALPDPLTQSAFCAAIAASRSDFDIQPCQDCTEAASATIK